MSSLTPPHCAACPFRREERLCMTPDGKHPPDCPTALCAAQAEACLADYEQPEVRRMAREAAIVERESYALRPDGMRLPCRPRILEIVAFAKAMDYRRLGLVFCIGLRAEAKETALIFEAHGLEVVSAVCKVGRIPKTRWGLRKGSSCAPGTPKACATPCFRPTHERSPGGAQRTAGPLRGARYPGPAAAQGPDHRTGRQGPHAWAQSPGRPVFRLFRLSQKPV